MKILRYLVISIIIVITFTAGGFLYLWMNKGVIPFVIPKIGSDLRIKEVHLTRAVAGRTEWELTAKSADYFKEKGVTYLDSPQVVFYGEKGKRMELEGDNGEIFNDTNDITVSGNVKITTSDGYLLRSDSLRYSSEKKVVTTESKVFIKGKGLEIEGIGMSADIERNTALIKRGVKAVLEGNVK